MINGDTMNAIGINAFGGADKLEMLNVATPKINDDQVLVQVRNTGINPIDWKTREGMRKERYKFNFPIILGQEMSGVVIEVGKNVTNFKMNDEVFGYGVPSAMGTYAQYYAIDADLITKKGDQVSFAEAAGVGMTGTTAHEALFEYGHLTSGQTVLILAGSGGVGSIAIQLAKNAGAKVITTTGTNNVEMVKNLGADQVIDYKKENFIDIVKNVDLVIDTLGGQNQLEAFGAAKKGGTVVSIVGETTQAIQLSKLYDIEFHTIVNRPNHDIITELGQLMADDKLHVNIANDLPFSVENAQQLENQSQTGHTDGKLVMNLPH